MQQASLAYIKKLLEINQLYEALELIESIDFDKDAVKSDIHLQRSRWQSMQNDMLKGEIAHSEFIRRYNQIRSNLIAILETNYNNGEKGSTTTKSIENKSSNSITFDQSYFHFTKLSLQNLRSFSKKQDLSFLDKDGQPARWNIIIGDNGVGKTTVLRSLALVLLFYKNASPWKKQILPGVFMRNEKDNPKIEFGVKSLTESAKESLGYNFQLTVTDTDFLPDGKSNFLAISDWVEGLNVFAYGASRKIGATQFTSESNGFPAANLFDENALLTNAEEWLVRTEYLALKEGKAKDTLQKVTELLIRLLGKEVQNIEIQTKGDKPVAMFKTDYGWVELNNLSLGYKTLIGWMVDFAKGMFERYPDSKDPLSEPAVLLIDEIDLHLHPKLQQQLMKFLTDAFPKTQFIATAHSPLVVQSAENSNVILLKKSGDHVVVEQNPFEIKNWRIDQLLTSDLYGLPSARAPQTDVKIERRRALLKKEKRSKKEETELEQLDEELVGMPVTENSDVNKAMEIIQKAAKHYAQPQNVLVKGDAAAVAEPAKHYRQDQNDKD